MRSILRRLRQYFVVGLIVVAPLGATLFILSWAFRAIDAILGQPLEQSLGVRVPGLGVVILALLILLVGWAVHLTVGRRLLQAWNTELSRFPLTRRIYNAGSQIVQAMVGGDRRVFTRPVLLPYPAEGSWAVGFVTNEGTPVYSEIIGEPCLTVFVPTTFSFPPSGNLLIVPRARVRPLDVSVEDAFKFVVSAGAVLPTGTPSQPGLDLAKLLGEERPRR
jgi:uncharacterized membrane protein